MALRGVLPRAIALGAARAAAASVPYYWTLDLSTRTIEASRLVGDEYESLGVCGPGSSFQPVLFPGLDIPIDDLWG